jgi:4'-phosphopantetheinyl transferase
MPVLAEGTAYVWWAELGEARAQWADLLDPAERERLAAYRRAEDRDRFLLGCAIVRHALGAHLGMPPSAVPLDRHCPDCDRPHGKVRLAGGIADAPELSVSHSGRWVAVAAHLGGPVGVDVEQVRGLDAEGLSRLVLAPDEWRALADLPGEARTTAFVRLWCRKEAVVKSTGDGLRANLAEVVVSGPDEPAALLSWRRRPDLAHGLLLRDLAPRPEHAGCLAVQTTRPVRVLERPAAELFGTAD